MPYFLINFLNKVQKNYLLLIIIFFTTVTFGFVLNYNFSETTNRITIPAKLLPVSTISNEKLVLDNIILNETIYVSKEDYIMPTNIRNFLKKEFIDYFDSSFTQNDKFIFFENRVSRPQYFDTLFESGNIRGIKDIFYNSENSSFQILADSRIINKEQHILPISNFYKIVHNDVSIAYQKKYLGLTNQVLYMLRWNNDNISSNNYKINENKLNDKKNKRERYEQAVKYANLLDINDLGNFDSDILNIFTSSSLPKDSILGTKNLKRLIAQLDEEILLLEKNLDEVSDSFRTKIDQNNELINKIEKLSLEISKINNINIFSYNTDEITFKTYRSSNDIIIISLLLALTLSVIFIILRKN